MSAQSYPTIRLGEAVDRVTKGTTPTTHGYAYTEKGISFLRVENLQNGVVDTSKVRTFISPDADRFLKRSSLESGDLLISIAGTIGRVAIIRDHDIPANTNQAVAIIRGAAKRFEPVFLRYALESPLLHRHITGEARGGAMQNISLENVRDVIVPIPPLPEQRRIVAEIEKQFTRLEAGVAALRRVQANLKRYRAAVLKAACEGRLVPTELKKWKVGSLRDVLVGIDAGKSFRCEERPPTASEIGVVKVSSVTWGTYNELESKTCHDPGRIEERYFVSPNDFLFSRANTIELIGACVIAQQVTLRVMLSDKILRFHFSSAVNPRWVLYWLRSDFGRSEIERLATGNQESMRNIGQERIRQIAMKFPPVAEQTRIVEEVERRLSVVDELESMVSANLQRAIRLRQSILQRAFTGNLNSSLV